MLAYRSRKRIHGFGLALSLVAAILSFTCRNRPTHDSQFNAFNTLIAQQQYAAADQLVRQNPALAQQAGPSGRTPLFIAVSQRNPSPEFIRTLVSLKTDVNAADDLRITPLMIASERDDTTILGILLKAGADPNRRDNAARSALNRAVQFRRTNAVKTLIENGARLDIFDAAALGLQDEVAKLIKRDPSLATRRGDHGFTALQVAAFRQQSKVVKLLVPLQDEMDICTAAVVGNIQALRKSLNLKASPNKPAGNGLPPLLCAVMARQTESAQVLLDFGAHAGGGAAEGISSPLVTAIRNGDKDIVALLLKHGADKDELIPGFGTPYTIAIAANRPDIAELLK